MSGLYPPVNEHVPIFWPYGIEDNNVTSLAKRHFYLDFREISQKLSFGNSSMANGEINSLYVKMKHGIIDKYSLFIYDILLDKYFSSCFGLSALRQVL